MAAAASRASVSGTSGLQALAQHLRRCPKAAPVTRPNHLTLQAGSGRSIGWNSTSAEATVGAGVKASGLIVNSRRARQRHWAITARRP